MKSATLATFVLLFFINSASGANGAAETGPTLTAPPEDEVEITKEDSKTTNAQFDQLEDFCFFPGTPPATEKYIEIRKLKVGKGSYGQVIEILPKLATHAQKIGADAIINYTGSQRFGFWPWRIVRPVVRGVAIKWTDPKKRDCAAIGGSTLKTIIATNKAPPA